MLYKILDAFGIIDKTVQLGISPQMDKAQRHGVVHYDTQAGVRHIGFLADKPQRITANDKDIVKSMFRQLDIFGLPAIIIEVKRGRGVQLIKRASGSLAAARLRAL